MVGIAQHVIVVDVDDAVVGTVVAGAVVQDGVPAAAAPCHRSL